MNVKRICFLGTRTRNFEATSALFRDVLGLRGVHAGADWSIFQLPSARGDFVEVYGPENAIVVPAEVGEGVVVAFAVDDIAAAREELAAATPGGSKNCRSVHFLDLASTPDRGW